MIILYIEIMTGTETPGGSCLTGIVKVAKRFADIYLSRLNFYKEQVWQIYW
jgi:hypothetical protein